MLWRRIWWVPLIWRQQLAAAKEVKAQDSQKATGITGNGLVPAVITGITDSWCQPVVGADETGKPWSRQGLSWLKAAAKAKAKAKGKVSQGKRKGKGMGTSTGGARSATTTTRAGERNAMTVVCRGKSVNGKRETNGRLNVTRTAWEVRRIQGLCRPKATGKRVTRG